MTTPILGITELAASQSQPEVIVNRAIRILEAFSPLSVVDRDLTTPPGSPSDGDRYIIPAGATGVWSSKEGQIALYLSTDWVYVLPRAGWMAYVQDEDAYVRYATGSPSAWIAFP